MKKVLTLIPLLVLFITALSGCINNISHNETNGSNENSKKQALENETINLSEAFDFLNNGSEAYVKLRKEYGYVGVAPGSLNNVFYSDNNDDISKILAMLNQRATKADTQMMPTGGFYLEYRLYINEEAYDEIRITNNLIIWNKAYYLLTKPYDIELSNNENQIYSFVTYNDNCKVYKNNEYINDFNRINELEFIKSKEIAKDLLLTVDCNGFELYVTGEKEFYIKNSSNNSYEYYKIVGEVSLSHII